MIETGLPEPTYEEAGGSFVTIFHNPSQHQGNQETTQETTQKTVEKTVAIIKANPQITQKELMSETGLTRRGVEWNLKKLKAEKRIRRIGPDKGGHWEVHE